VHLVGYNSVADNTDDGSIFIRLAVIASESREMSRNSKKIWPWSWCQWKAHMWLHISHCIFSRICYRVRDIHA